MKKTAFANALLTVLMGVLIGVLALIPFAAVAHAFDVYQGNDYVHVGVNHLKGRVYDMECDSHSVYVQVKTGSFYTTVAEDENGCAEGYTVFDYDMNPQPPLYHSYYIRICEAVPNETDPCSTWTLVD